jgi:hypothetical protein
MRDIRVTPSYGPEPFTRLLTRPLPLRTRNCPRPHAARPLARPTRYCARGGHGQRLLPGRAGLHARAGEALGPFDAARWSERADEQELRMHGDETEGGSQGSRAGGRFFRDNSHMPRVGRLYYRVARSGSI